MTPVEGVARPSNCLTDELGWGHDRRDAVAGGPIRLTTGTSLLLLPSSLELSHDRPLPPAEGRHRPACRRRRPGRRRRRPVGLLDAPRAERPRRAPRRDALRHRHDRPDVPRVRREQPRQHAQERRRGPRAVDRSDHEPHRPAREGRLRLAARPPHRPAQRRARAGPRGAGSGRRDGRVLPQRIPRRRRPASARLPRVGHARDRRLPHASLRRRRHDGRPARTARPLSRPPGTPPRLGRRVAR